MKSLTDALIRIKDLGRDLDAFLPEEGHWGFCTPRSSDPALRISETRDVWVPDSADKPAVPDTQRREAAKTRLQEIYGDSSSFLRVRYKAGRALGMARSQLREDLGYGRLKLWTRLHPVATGIVVAGVASGLAYATVEYLSR